MKPPTPTPEQAVLIAKLQKERMLPRFSRNLANFVKCRVATRVLLVTPRKTAPSWEVSLFRRNPKPPKGRVDDHCIYLTDREDPWTHDYFHGIRLSSVLISGGASRVCNQSWKKADFEVEDITDWFWATYAKIGKCLWDWQHKDYGFVSKTWSSAKPNGDDERFKAIDDQTVKCKWCSDVLHLRRKVSVEVHVRHTWAHGKVRGTDKTFRCLRCHRPHPIADLHQEMRGYGPLKKIGNSNNRREEIALKKTGYCPKCFIAVTVATPQEFRAILPSELLTPLKINT